MWKLQRSLAAAQRTAALLTAASPSHVTDAATPSPSSSAHTAPSPSPAPSPVTEGSVIGGATTSLLAGAPHSPHRDVNPVPQSHSAPRGTQPLESGQVHHDNEAGTTETDEPVDADDNTHRSLPAPRDHVADTVAPTAQSSQAPASDTGGVPHINDSASHSGADDAQQQFISPQRRRSQREHLRQQADVILITDSTGKYVDSSRFMGRQNYTFHMRASTSEVVLRDLNRWPANDNVKYIILHNGVNDVRGGKTVSEIVGNLKASLTTTKKRFPRAKSAYSEMLYIGSEESNPELNGKVRDIYMQIKSFCYENGHYFVAHNALQIGTSDLYDDDVHIIRGGGTALFVNEIHETLTRRNRPPQEHAHGLRVYRLIIVDFLSSVSCSMSCYMTAIYRECTVLTSSIYMFQKFVLMMLACILYPP